MSTEDPNNYTTTPLLANATFTGQTSDVHEFQSITTTLQADVASASNSIHFQFSIDGVEWFTSVSRTYTSGVLTQNLPVVARYFRVVYVNGSAPQTMFRLQTFLSPVAVVTTSSGSTPSQGNASTATLAAGATFTGSWEDTQPYVQIVSSFKATQQGTFTMQFSADATTVARSIGPYTLPANTDSVQPLAPVRRYYRIVFVNTSADPSTLAISTTYNQLSSIFQTRVSDQITTLTPTTTSRSALFGKSIGGDYYDSVGAVDGKLFVAVREPATAFGELSTCIPTPVAHILYNYGLISQNVITSGVNGGSVTAASSMAVLASGTTNGGSAILYSRRELIYQPGQGGMGRFSGLFSTPQANTTQIIGLGSSNEANGLFFGYNGTSFGILYINNSVSTWTPQASWNIDVMNGAGGATNPTGVNLNPLTGNVFQIRYQYLGFGSITFFVESAETGLFEPVHRIGYPNTATSTNFSNPSFRIYARATCTSGGVGVTLRTASGALFIEGQQLPLGARYGLDNNKALLATTQTSLLAIRTLTTFNGVVNQSQIRVSNISIACANGGTPGVVVLRVYLNPTLGGTPSWTPVENGQSMVEYDIAGTTVTGGVVKFNASVASNGSTIFDTTGFGLFLNAGDMLVFAGYATRATEMSVSICWNED
jgi:hypothetical protein